MEHIHSKNIGVNVVAKPSWLRNTQVIVIFRFAEIEQTIFTRAAAVFSVDISLPPCQAE